MSNANRRRRARAQKARLARKQRNREREADTPVCPECNSRALLRSATVVYGDRAADWGEVYACPRYPECDHYVGVHKNTTRAKGTMAGPALRRWRVYAHRVFDPLWRGGDAPMSRTEAYKLMADILEIERAQAHVGMLTGEQCKALAIGLARRGHVDDNY